MKEKLGIGIDAGGRDNSAELAKNFGTDVALVVALAPSGSCAACEEPDAEAEGPELGIESAICGIAAKIGVDGAGAATALVSAVTVTGGL